MSVAGPPGSPCAARSGLCAASLLQETRCWPEHLVLDRQETHIDMCRWGLECLPPRAQAALLSSSPPPPPPPRRSPPHAAFHPHDQALVAQLNSVCSPVVAALQKTPSPSPHTPQAWWADAAGKSSALLEGIAPPPHAEVLLAQDVCGERLLPFSAMIDQRRQRSRGKSALEHLCTQLLHAPPSAPLISPRVLLAALLCCGAALLAACGVGAAVPLLVLLCSPCWSLQPLDGW
ncbi:hypothetical protein C2E20_6957 [Micractinium conductrix]|uniref:Uncharacterized protein n=1 Tax=Micractinium conductrix TaxID=554055 RepID=A0A2P6V636_9CHLO|nr:hypothetical protein C2E20_6957 [Micractinium conductrix]|eukprot:PSC69553.1 hypothetical protein C2E20_6957 [Micractinium conductrix]